MGLNRAFDRAFFVMGGAVKTTGSSLNLGKGQLALIDRSKTTPNGAKVVNTVAGKPKDAKDFVLRCGVADREPNRSFSNKDESTMPFSLNEVVDLKVSAPENTERKVDEVIIGYNGMDADTAFGFRTGDAYFRLSLELTGGAVAYRGGKGDTEVVSINVEIPECDPFNDCVTCNECDAVDCKVVVMEAIERLKRRQLTGGMTVDQLVDITPVFSCDTPANPTETPWNYFCLEVCDEGSDGALALVQNQYDGVPVIRTDRVGSTSTYQIFQSSNDAAPTDYHQTLASVIKGCADCPSGWTATPEGVLYAFTVEDDGADLSALFTALPGYVASSITRGENSAGVGFYTAIMDDELTDAEITSFLTGAAPRNTATIEKLGMVKALCENATVTSTAWTQCGTCNVAEDTYTIVLPDDECGNDRLAELNANYKQTVTIAQTAGKSVTVTLTGTGGDATLVVGTETYGIPFVTDLSTSAAAVVTASAADMLANQGITLTSSGAVLTLEANDGDFILPTVTAGSGNLGGTVSAETITQVDDKGGCQTRYKIPVVTNIVCDECDPIYKDYYVSEAPESYDGVKWKLQANADNLPSGNCLCGIKFKAKEFNLEGDECLRDLVGFTESSVQIRVAAGYPEEIREGIGRLPKGTYETTYLSKWTPRTHLGGELRNFENESRYYFRGTKYRSGHKGYLGRLLRGETSNIEDQSKQYVQYTLTVSHFNHTQSFAARINEDINYDIFVEVGRHKEVEALLNNIASASGVSTVKAFG